jgi:hypothetical protein
MASPVQIILNPDNFSEDRDVPTPGGPKTEFFERDVEFVAHRRKIAAELRAAAEELRRSAASVGEVGHIKVILRRRAWAKSHRPFHIFQPSRCPLVGGLDLGELIFEATPRSLEFAALQVEGAEDKVEWRMDRDGKLKPWPTAKRSETGAIERIEVYGAADRRQFDIEQAIVWLSDARTGGQYEIELFDAPPPRVSWDALGNHEQMFRSFLSGLQGIGNGLTVNRLEDRSRRDVARLTIRLERSPLPPRVQITGDTSQAEATDKSVSPFDDRVERHRKLLKFLENHPLVRRIDLPGVVVRNAVSAETARSKPAAANLPDHNTARNWPRVGVIDGGVSDAAIGDWVIGRWDLLADSDIDQEHGTFIAGLLLAASSLNGSDTSSDPDGTEIYDIAVYPNSDPGFRTYHGTLDGFLEQIEYAIVEARTRHGVRVFNFSMNVQTLVASNYYSRVAERLDAIADTHDVLICISAGNLVSPRPEWAADTTANLKMLAASQNDGIFIPAESARNMAVGALNPKGLGTVLGHVPANYTRRGPGLRCLMKPDLTYVGGAGHGSGGHGLYSLAPDGSVAESCGTSFSTPLLAKQAALLDSQIEGDVSRETLMGILTHHARLPDGLMHKELGAVSRQLAGHGMPPSVSEMLDGGDHQITLVFATRLMPGKQMRFQFAWPTCLVTNGKCRGRARLTLVASPPLDQRFGAEFVRVNVEAALQQETVKKGKAGWTGQLKPLYLPESTSEHPLEAERVEYGLKWSPVKVYGDTMARGRGASSNWRLLVSYVSRTDNTAVPKEGIPFTAILTIEDPDGEQPVFTIMRQQLASSTARIADIRTAARVTTRV